MDSTAPRGNGAAVGRLRIEWSLGDVRRRWVADADRGRPMTDDPTNQPIIDVVTAITATEGEAITLLRQVLDGECIIIITSEGVSAHPAKARRIRFEDESTA
jgi:hypothetical protein